MILKMSEGELQAAVIQFAELHRWRLYHVAKVKKQLRSHTSEGFPDLVMLRGKRQVAAELKREGERPDGQAAGVAGRVQGDRCGDPRLASAGLAVGRDRPGAHMIRCKNSRCEKLVTMNSTPPYCRRCRDVKCWGCRRPMIVGDQLERFHIAVFKGPREGTEVRAYRCPQCYGTRADGRLL